MISLNFEKSLLAADGKMNLQIQLEIEGENFVTLYGESGAGKTSTLRILAGLMKPNKGKVIVNNETWFDSNRKINLKPQNRKIGFVFQDYTLFPNMTVRENLEFALRKNQDRKIISDLIEIIELGELQNRKPETLSGGQKQRTALARTLVQKPKILLLDEPLSALDHKIRLKLQDYLAKVHREFKLTTILISHDIGEIVKLSNQVFILEKGKISKQGTPTEIFINQSASDDFQIAGEILKIEKKENAFEITTLIQTNLIKVNVNESEGKKLKIGDKVMLVSKDWSPKIFKIEN